MDRRFLCSIILILFLFFPVTILAQDSTGEEGDTTTEEPIEEGVNPEAIANSILQDVNGDELVIVDAFGDSITRGVGDFTGTDEYVSELPLTPSGEAGYPLRVETILGVDVSNKGKAGEKVVSAAVNRFARIIPGSASDIVIISGGSNDAFQTTSPNRLQRSIQIMVNIASASRKEVVIATAPPACCERAGIAPQVREYNNKLREISVFNDLPLADVEHAFNNTCDVTDSCFLLNLPEGLHPNVIGYDVQGEVIMAALLKIDLFGPTGPTDLEDALGLIPGSVITIPDPLPIVEPVVDPNITEEITTTE